MSIKRFIQALVAVALGAAVAVSCEQKIERIPVLTLENTTIGNGGGSQFLEVASDSDWTISVEYGMGTGWVHFSQTSGPAGIMNIAVTFDPNENKSVRSATIKLKTASYPVEGKSWGTLKIKQAGSLAGTLPQWLELPAIEATEKMMVFGSYDMEGVKYKNRAESGLRNYSFYWDVDGLVSIWVAYPLNKDLYGNGKYDYQWTADPILTEQGVYQPDITEHSYGGRDWNDDLWNRGHQMARADRQLTQASVMSSCYPTNITPQGSKFNGGIWGSLEVAVRNKAGSSKMDPKKDTLYVVTGCTQEGSNTWTSSYYQREVKVPSAYFKALLRKQGTNYSAVGFYLPHNAETETDNYMNYIYPISELETKLGYKLFVNLELVPELDAAAIAAIKSPADPTAVFNAW
jgi:endonuclease G